MTEFKDKKYVKELDKGKALVETVEQKVCTGYKELICFQRQKFIVDQKDL